MQAKLSVRMIAFIGVLTALYVVLSRFLSIINTPTIRIGLGFLPIVLAAIVLGPWQAGVVAALGDIVGALVHPVGPYFPGFTVTAFFSGLILGLLIYKKKNIFITILAVVIHQLVFSLLIDTIWISILYGASYTGYVLTRLPECGIHIALEIIIILVAGDRLRRLRPVLLS